MPAKRSSMRKIRDVLRLKFEEKRSHGRIAQITGLSKGAVANYVRRAGLNSIGWPIPAEMDDGVLEGLLFGRERAGAPKQFAPVDCEHVHKELARVGVTLQLLWEDYASAHGERAYKYTQFCEHYQRFRSTLRRSMRQVHRAGEKLFIDYSGKGIDLIDRETGEIIEVQIFVASMCASKYTYAEATRTQSLPDWIGSHVRMFEYFGCVPEILVPDNLKSAIQVACRYEPEETSTYYDMATHFGCSIIPARPRKPKDKAIVESHVLVVQRWIVARLRNRQFFSLLEINAAILELLEDLNQRPFQKLTGSRASAFAEIDRPAMKPLPTAIYHYADFCRPIVNIDYHIEVGVTKGIKHYYSVPHHLVGQRLFVKYTSGIVECYFKGRLVAAHARSFEHGKASTLDEHRPESHRQHSQWSPSRLLSWGEKIGIGTRAVVRHMMESRPHPEHGYRSCLGLMRLAKEYGEQRLEAACRLALNKGDPSYKRIQKMLKNKMENEADWVTDAEASPTTSLIHGNVRGAQYFESSTATEAQASTDTDTNADSPLTTTTRH
jgi:transposase